MKNHLLNDFARRMGANRYMWEPVGAEAMRRAHRLVFGQSAGASFIEWIEADYISDCGFRHSWELILAPTEAQKSVSVVSRKPGNDMNKLVSAAESLLSLTGANADERHRIRPSQAVDFLSLEFFTSLS